MITLTINVPAPVALINAGFTTLQLQKSATKTSAGAWMNVSTASVALDPAITAYTLIDPAGVEGDWYVTVYTGTSGSSSISTPTPGYFTELTNNARDLLGVTTNEISDAQILGFSYLPSALSRIRQRFPLFDATVATGGDSAQLALGALSHLLASMLCSRMIMLVMDLEVFKDYRYQRNRSLDWSATAASLMDTYETLISQASGESSTNPALYLVGTILAGPTSSGLDTSAGLIPLENDLLPVTTGSDGES